MTPTMTPEVVEMIQQILKKGSRAEVMIENGKIAVVEIRRKLRYK